MDLGQGAGKTLLVRRMKQLCKRRVPEDFLEIAPTLGLCTACILFSCNSAPAHTRRACGVLLVSYGLAVDIILFVVFLILSHGLQGWNWMNWSGRVLPYNSGRWEEVSRR